MKNWLIKKLGGHIESDVEILRDRIINDVLDNPTIYEMARRYKDGLKKQMAEPVCDEKIKFMKLEEFVDKVTDKNNILSEEE